VQDSTAGKPATIGGHAYGTVIHNRDACGHRLTAAAQRGTDIVLARIENRMRATVVSP
jgi:hypothetical protein